MEKKSNYNLSLDDIIKMKKSKGPKNSKKPAPKKIKNNGFPRNVKKSIAVQFKSKSRKKKLSVVPDARMTILQNKKRLSGKFRSPLLKNSIVDARLKIEARKKRDSVEPVSVSRRDFGITKLAPDGIIQRKINATRFDNSVSVEYEDEEMDLEHESIKLSDWKVKPLTIRRTVHNFSHERVYRDDSRMDSAPYFRVNDDNDIPYKEVTRTIPNVKRSPLTTSRKTYKRNSPVRQYSSYDDEREISRSRLSPLSHPSPMHTRESTYHRIMITNLHENVTGEDIKELFEDVGDLVYTKMLRTGMAEVAYKSQKDAMKAVEIYHNRQLDGLPMKCTMVSSNGETTTSKKRTPGYVPPVNTFQSVEPDTRIIKKALFSG